MLKDLFFQTRDTVSGKEFNESLGKYRTFCKILKPSQLSYKIGFNKIGEGDEPLIFFDRNKSYLWIREKDDVLIATITIPDDSEVYLSHISINNLYFKTNQFNIVSIHEIPFDIYLDLVQSNRACSNTLELVPRSFLNAHPEIYYNAIKQNTILLEDVPIKAMIACSYICLAAVRKNGLDLQFVPMGVLQECPMIMMEAVKQNGLALASIPQEIREAHPDLCLAAVLQNRAASKLVPLKVHSSSVFRAGMYKRYMIECNAYPKLKGPLLLHYRKQLETCQTGHPIV